MARRCEYLGDTSTYSYKRQVTIVPVAQVVYSDDTRPFPFPHPLIKKEAVSYARLVRNWVAVLRIIEVTAL